MSNVEVGARTAQVWSNAASATVQSVPKGSVVRPADSEPESVGSKEAELTTVRSPEQMNNEENNLDALVERSNSSEQLVARNLKINVDDASGKYVLSVHDAQTDEVIRQWPPEGYLKMAENISRLLEENGSVGKLLSEQS